jgi:surfactin synthase thioesterase subunit/glycosyltransferase involved in cell wall biosynthesis
MKALAKRGHDVWVLAGGEFERERIVDGIRIRSYPHLQREGYRVREAVEEFAPDYVLVSSEDLSHTLLREAHSAARHRLVYLAHTPQWFPFGPESWYPDAEAARLVRDALAVVAIGHSTARYVREHLGREAMVVHPALYGEGPWERFANFDKRTALLINGCTVKGLPIVLDLAARHQNVRFLVLRGWGTTAGDLAAMAAVPNLTVLEPVGRIEEALEQASVLLAPSLWYEGFGLVVTEAMLRGLPVLAADHGGLRDAARDCWRRPAVRPITRWLAEVDDTGMPLAVVEAQPVEEWSAALGELLENRHLYEREAERGRRSAEELAGSVKAEDLEELLLQLRPAAKRVLLVHNSTYYPGAGGGDKSNRLLMEALAVEGCVVEVFTRLERFGEDAHRAYCGELARRSLAYREDGRSVWFRRHGVDVEVITREVNLRVALREALDRFRPDVIFCSTDDPAHLFLETALRHSDARVIYLVRATIALPFGKDASTLNAERTERLRQADAVLCVSEYVAEYCRREGGLDAVHVPISLPDDREPPYVGSYANEYVTLVNPSDVKGLPILLGLADALPDVRFAAVPSWGTTAKDLAALRARPNITLLEPVEDITDVLRRTRVTLVPSLWAEARSRMVLESLSRGVPVLAADVGGLREAMCGVDYVLPVNPILRYRPALSEQMVPEADVPEQDLAPWIAALRTVLASEEEWLRLSAYGREAGLAYLGSISARGVDQVMEGVLRKRKRALRWVGGGVLLSAAKRRLLALRLEQAAARRRGIFAKEWGPAEGREVYLFPWAGAGAAGAAWEFLPQGEFRYVAIAPPLAGTFAERCAAVTAAFRERRVKQGAVFFGHSMGAAMAFEVLRALGDCGVSKLVASSCRAPHLRKDWSPPNAPGMEQLREDLVALGGMSAAEAASLPVVALEALAADLAAFREYRYVDGELLHVAVTAVCGAEEPHLSMEQVSAWHAETRGEFRMFVMEGGHFWFRQARRERLYGLLEDGEGGQTQFN